MRVPAILSLYAGTCCLLSSASLPARQQDRSQLEPDLEILSVADLLYRSPPPLASRLGMLSRRTKSDDEPRLSLLAQRGYKLSRVY